MELYSETLADIRRRIANLDDGLMQLKQETQNLPVHSDFRDVLLRYIEIAFSWEKLDDLKAIRETMVRALNMAEDQEFKDRIAEVIKSVDNLL